MSGEVTLVKQARATRVYDCWSGASAIVGPEGTTIEGGRSGFDQDRAARIGWAREEKFKPVLPKNSPVMN